MIAVLLTVGYGVVTRLQLPPGPRPEAIIYRGDVYRYYVHTVPVGHVETEPPYRLTSERPPIAGAYQAPTLASPLPSDPKEGA